MYGHSFDAFVSSQQNLHNSNDLSVKLQRKYWQAKQKYLAKFKKSEDECIVLSDTKLDAKLEIFRSIDKTSGRLVRVLENYQNCLFSLANEQNSLGKLLKECGRQDKTKAGKIMSITGKSFNLMSHESIRLYMPLLRLFQEMETFHQRAIDDTATNVRQMEDGRSDYRASLLWMKDASEKLDPDTYKQLEKFRRVQAQVKHNKKAFDVVQMDVVQKIDLLMASRCNLINSVLGQYQATLLEVFEKNCNNLKFAEDLIKKEDIYEYEFKTLKELNTLQSNRQSPEDEEVEEIASDVVNLMQYEQDCENLIDGLSSTQSESENRSPGSPQLVQEASGVADKLVDDEDWLDAQYKEEAKGEEELVELEKPHVDERNKRIEKLNSAYEDLMQVFKDDEDPTNNLLDFVSHVDNQAETSAKKLSVSPQLHDTADDDFLLSATSSVSSNANKHSNGQQNVGEILENLLLDSPKSSKNTKLNDQELIDRMFFDPIVSESHL